MPVQIMYPSKGKKMQGITFKTIFWDVDELTIKESQSQCDIIPCIEK